MAIETTSQAVEVGAAFIRAYCEGDADGMRRHAHPDILHEEANPGGFMRVEGVEDVIRQVGAEIAAVADWRTDYVEATAVGPKVRIDASVTFTRAGEPLRYVWTEYLVIETGRVRKRTVACAGALPAH